MFPFFTQLFLYGFGLDAILSFWSEIYKIQSGPIADIRQLIALSTMAQGCFLYVTMAFTRRVSIRLVGSPTLFLLWANLTFCFPLPLFYLPTSGLWMSSVQLALAIFLVLRFWRSHAVPVPSADGIAYGPGFVDPGTGREGFTWKRLLGFLGANALILPCLLTALVFSATIQGMDAVTGGYVRVRADGIYISQSRFQKNQHEVALDGMMHVADANFYNKMKWGVEGMKTLVLLEGVTDQDQLLTKGLGMEKLAKMFGLNSQMEHGEYRKTIDKVAEKEAVGEVAADGSVEVEKQVFVRRADVDVNTFSPQTIRYLQAVAVLFQSASLEDVIRIFKDKSSPLHNESIARGAMDDILTHRNAFLIQKIEEGLKTHDRIVVPWGAMHLIGIEQHLRAQGFREMNREEKPAVLFWKKAK